MKTEIRLSNSSKRRLLKVANHMYYYYYTKCFIKSSAPTRTIRSSLFWIVYNFRDRQIFLLPHELHNTLVNQDL